MATFTYTPSYSTSLDQQPRISEATFGDGYVQAIGDGINNNPKKWSINFNAVPLTDATTILAFFTTNNTAATPFDWTAPDGVAGRYKCKSWKRSYDGFGYANISCTFEEVFW